jgi:hypothetical protein
MPDNHQQETAVAVRQNVAALAPIPLAAVNIRDGVFASPAAFEHGQRMARALSSSELVPQQYRNNIPNTLIALDFALRGNFPPMMVLQGSNVIQGRLSWTAQFIGAALNSCGLYTAIRYEFRGTENNDDWACRVVTHERRDGGELLHGPWISIAMAKREGWYSRNGSKWQTMPEVMLRWRAVSFFGRLYAAHILAGMPSADELEDALGVQTAPAAGPVTFDAAPPVADPLAALRARITAPTAAEVGATIPTAREVAEAPPAAVGTAAAEPRRRGRPRNAPAEAAAVAAAASTAAVAAAAPEPAIEQPAQTEPAAAGGDSLIDPF